MDDVIALYVTYAKSILNNDNLIILCSDDATYFEYAKFLTSDVLLKTPSVLTSMINYSILYSTTKQKLVQFVPADMEEAEFT